MLGIAQFAKAAGVEEASARVMLRKINHKKAGRSYEFKNQDEMKKVIAKARAAKPEKKAAAPKKKKKIVKKKSPKPRSSTG